MNEKRIDVLGVGFDNFTMEEAVAEGVRQMNEPGAHYVVTPNPEIVEVCPSCRQRRGSGHSGWDRSDLWREDSGNAPQAEASRH